MRLIIFFKQHYLTAHFKFEPKLIQLFPTNERATVETSKDFILGFILKTITGFLVHQKGCKQIESTKLSINKTQLSC